MTSFPAATDPLLPGPAPACPSSVKARRARSRGTNGDSPVNLNPGPIRLTGVRVRTRKLLIGRLPAEEFPDSGDSDLRDSTGSLIMVAIDGFSRFVVLDSEPASDASGESLAVARFPGLLKLVGSSWSGRPKGIRTEGGSQWVDWYDNHRIDVFCHLLGFDRHVTLTGRLAYPSRPQANGKVERVNKEVGRHLWFSQEPNLG
jgi:hypothetical protein